MSRTIRADVSDMLGLTLIEIENYENDELTFKTDTGRVFRMYHYQYCCESVTLEDVIGDFDDLLNTVLLVAESRSSDDMPPKDFYADEFYQWTFYEFRTIKGSVTLRWFGTSNGYYSTEVDFEEVMVGS